MTHTLKTWPEYFEAIASGKKTFECRRNDRDFRVGDALQLEEYIPSEDRFTGRSITKSVPYIMHGPAFGLQDGFCVMSLI